MQAHAGPRSEGGWGRAAARWRILNYVAKMSRQNKLQYSQKKQWGDFLHENDEFQLAYLLREEQDKFYIHNEDIGHKFNTGDIEVNGTKEAIKTMGNNKSSGLDNCTAEVLKCLDDENLEEIAKILTEYW